MPKHIHVMISLKNINEGPKKPYDYNNLGVFYMVNKPNKKFIFAIEDLILKEVIFWNKKKFNLKLANKNVVRIKIILEIQIESFLRVFTSVSGIKNKTTKYKVNINKIKPKSILKK